MLRFDKLNSLLPHHSLLCAWAVVSKDQFCEIKFAFVTAVMRSFFVVRLGLFFVRLRVVWPAQAESIFARFS